MAEFDDLIRQLGAPQPETRQQAIRALARLRDARALPHLARIYRNDPQPAIRELANKAGRYIHRANQGRPQAEPKDKATPTPERGRLLKPVRARAAEPQKSSRAVLLWAGGAGIALVAALIAVLVIVLAQSGGADTSARDVVVRSALEYLERANAPRASAWEMWSALATGEAPMPCFGEYPAVPDPFSAGDYATRYPELAASIDQLSFGRGQLAQAVQVWQTECRDARPTVPGDVLRAGYEAAAQAEAAFTSAERQLHALAPR